MKYDITLGVVCLARKTFDFVAGKQIFDGIKEDLKRIEHVNWVIIPELVIEIDEALQAAKILNEKHVDAVVVISGTFHLGHLVLLINREVRKPILLWGLPELPYDGGKIRLNSVCGVNLNASNLYKSGMRSYYAIVQNTIDENWIDAIRIQVALKNSKIGIVGYRAHGFFNLDIDELDVYHKLGLLIDHYELAEIWNFEAKPEDIEIRKGQLKAVFDISKLSDAQLEKVATLSVKLNNFMNKYKLDAIAIRCWPEFAENFGISPCAAMSLLQSEGKIITCEGDIGGSISMVAHRAVGGETPFLADFSQVNFEENFALLWHCGVAACNLRDGKCNATLDTYFAGGKGVTAGFVMKPGDVSICRLDSAGQEMRVYLQKGMGIPMEKLLSGTYMKCIFKKHIREVLQTLIENGVAHHLSVVYGDFIKPFEIFAKINGWRVIQ